MLSQDIEAAKKPPRKYPTCITSFNWDGYQKYGKKFLETWREFWPEPIKLIVYCEGLELEPDDLAPNIIQKPIIEVEFLKDYLDCLKFPIQHGIVGDKYDINFDARMARKAFMEVYTSRTYGGKVFWLDADAVTYKHVPLNFLDECLPDDKFCCYLGRDGWYFTESGFLGFNAEHPIAKEFFRNYLHIFITGVIFTQQWWHDCIGFDCTRFLANENGKGGEFVNLSAHCPKGTMHPHANSAPGKYITHLKGNRKETGELKEGDVL